MTTFSNSRRMALLTSINGAAISLRQLAAGLRARRNARRGIEELRHLDPAIRSDIGLSEGTFVAI
jgi:uncharacterized protein YjiS (DUF1127 family)